MNTEDSILKLLRRIQAGDESSIDILCHLLSPEIRKIAKSTPSKYGINIDPDDVAQETMIRVLGVLKTKPHQLPSFENIEKLRVWLYGIAKYAVMDRSMKERYRKFSLSAQDIEEESSESAVDTREQLYQALKQFSDRDRLIVEARINGASLEDVANQFHLTPATVRRIYSHVTQKLRDTIEMDSRPRETIKKSPVELPKSVPLRVEPLKRDGNADIRPLTPRSEIDPLIEVYFAGDNLSSKEIRLFLDYLAARYREVGGTGLSVVEGQTLVPEMAEVTT